MANLRKRDTGEYPVSENEFKLRHPNTSFPAVINYGEFGYDVVFPAPTPAYDPITQTVREIAPVLTVLGHYEQAWEVVELYATQEEKDAAIAASLAACCEGRCADVESLYLEKLYTDTTVTFPDGDKVVQFRDSTDRGNLESVCLTAAGLVAIGAGATPMVYRTADDVNQALTATQMMNIGLAVSAAKQVIRDKGWAHKVALRAICAGAGTDAEKVEAITAYDITGGW